MGAKYQIKEGSISSFLYEISKGVNIYMIFHAEKPFLHDFMFDVSESIKMFSLCYLTFLLNFIPFNIIVTYLHVDFLYII